MPKLLACQTCRATFRKTGRGRNPKYCSTSCRILGNRLQHKEAASRQRSANHALWIKKFEFCNWCLTVPNPQGRGTYCSESCQKQARNHLANNPDIHSQKVPLCQSCNQQYGIKPKLKPIRPFCKSCAKTGAKRTDPGNGQFCKVPLCAQCNQPHGRGYDPSNRDRALCIDCKKEKRKQTLAKSALKTGIAKICKTCFQPTHRKSSICRACTPPPPPPLPPPPAKAAPPKWRWVYAKNCPWCDHEFFPTGTGDYGKRTYCSKAHGRLFKNFTERGKDRSEIPFCKSCGNRCVGVKIAKFCVQCKRKQKKDKSSRFTGRRLVALFGPNCHICHEAVDLKAHYNSDWAPTVDHIQPIAKGGQDILSNVAVAHRFCNTIKNTHDIDSTRSLLGVS
jgi:HNH endonuclease